ncbi:MAG TPA: hypothetical protein VN277_03010 [Acidiferrobacterales bacterium]|nr:hypothetical protein [Acidiferrobacterales bacterium]
MSTHATVPPVALRRLPRILITGLLYALASDAALAMPVFARQYDMTCAACHAAYPRLNAFGEQFRDNNYRMSNWREKTTIDTKDDLLALPKYPPLALRMQTFVQGRQGREVNSTYDGFTNNNAEFDFQTPYLIKLLSSAPLSDHITYYFYGIFAEKGANGETLIEDAWFRHDDAFGTKIGTMLGQFQVSDLMYPRETRLTFQDFMAYRMAGITYDRGVIFDRAFGPVSLALGAVNGNGITDNFTVNSPGYRRADHMFDNDTRKNVFGRVGVDVGPVNIGLFGLSGQQKSRSGALGATAGTRDTDKRIAGLDLSGSIGAKTHWFTQALWNDWQGFLDSNPAQDYRWWGGFAGVDYIHSDRWAFSLLYNYADANDFENSGTIFEGIHINALTVTASYYFMRNVKGVIELTGDFQKETASFTAHPTKEGYVLVGIDAAF